MSTASLRFEVGFAIVVGVISLLLLIRRKLKGSKHGLFLPKHKSFTAADHRDYRLYKSVQSVARDVLHAILLWGCPKQRSESMEHYLKVTLKMTSTEYRKYFDRDQKLKLQSDVEGCTFDVTLLFKCIQLTCQGLAPPGDPKWVIENYSQLEYLITLVKKFRNDFLHNQQQTTAEEFVLKTENLRDILTKLLTVGGKFFHQNEPTVKLQIQKVNDMLNSIRSAPLVHADLMNYQEEVLYEHLKQILAEKGREELSTMYGTISQINPMHFLTGVESTVDVSGVFTHIEVESVGRVKRGTPVDYTSLLDVQEYINIKMELTSGNCPSRAKASIILVEGVAGSGKTTLSRFLLSEWKNRESQIKGLHDYHLLLYIECRNCFFTSLAELFSSVMPETCRKFLAEDFCKIAFGLRLLVVVDGLDELNPYSEKIFLELLNKVRGKDIVIFCTTRPEKIQYFYKTVPNYLQTIHFKIIGISKEKQKEFISIYYDRFISEGVCGNVQHEAPQLTKLFALLPSLFLYLGDHLYLPLNLVLLTYLWVVAPESIKQIETASALYLGLHKIIKEKLIERVQKKLDLKSFSAAEDHCSEVLSYLYQKSLRALSKHQIILKESDYDGVQTVCNRLGLVGEEVISAFLVVQVVWTPLGFRKSISFPHKGLQDFMAAQAIVDNLKAKMFTAGGFYFELKQLLEKHSIPHDIKEQVLKYLENIPQSSLNILPIFQSLHDEDKSSFNLEMYQNVLLHIPAILKHREINFSPFCEELIILLHEIGSTDTDQWLNILSDLDYGVYFCQLVAKKMSEMAIHDGNLSSIPKLLEHDCPENVVIKLKYELESEDVLIHVIDLLSQYHCKLELYMYQHFKYPSTYSTCSDKLQDAFKKLLSSTRCQLTRFRGVLNAETIAILPASLWDLYLGLSKEEQAKYLSYLQTLPSLSWIHLHLTPSVPFSCLTPLPQVKFCYLYLSGVSDGDVEWAWKASVALQPLEGYSILLFPDCNLTKEGMKLLLMALGKEGVKTKGFWFSGSQLNEDDEYELRKQCLAVLKCGFSRSYERSIWQF